MAMLYCRVCAKEIHESAATCPHCGAVHQAGSSGEVSSTIIIIGYIMAVLFPFAGGVIGIYTLAKGKTAHGIGIIAASFLFFIFLSMALWSTLALSGV